MWVASLLAFDAYLRVNEFCNLRVSDVACAGDVRLGTSSISTRMCLRLREKQRIMHFRNWRSFRFGLQSKFLTGVAFACRLRSASIFGFRGFNFSPSVGSPSVCHLLLSLPSPSVSPLPPVSAVCPYVHPPCTFAILHLILHPHHCFQTENGCYLPDPFVFLSHSPHFLGLELLSSCSFQVVFHLFHSCFCDSPVDPPFVSPS